MSNDAVNVGVYIPVESLHSFLLDISPEVKSLDHMVILCLIF